MDKEELFGPKGLTPEAIGKVVEITVVLESDKTGIHVGRLVSYRFNGSESFVYRMEGDNVGTIIHADSTVSIKARVLS